MREFRIAFCAALVFAVFLTSVNCGGTVELRLIQYYNRHGHDGTKDHCDSFLGWFKTTKCDPYFEIKMDGGNRVSWSMVKTKTYWNTDTVDFGRKLGSYLYNPIRRHFASWSGHFNLEVKVMDADTVTQHDHMDTIYTSLRILPGDSDKPRMASGIKHGMDSRLTFAVSVKCDEHYYPPYCTRKCEPHDDYHNGHYTCTKGGLKKCLPTWHDEFSDCKRRNVCEPNPCLHGGKCIMQFNDRFRCSCRPHYHGLLCEVRTKPCEEHDHCLNGGTCINDGIKDSHCKCSKGWSGRFCEVDKNECNSTDNPCQNGGTCVNLPGSFSCKCAPQFEGSTCDQDKDECEEDDPEHPLCLHNGTCTNTYGGFECNCPEGINGTHCEKISGSFKDTLTVIIGRMKKPNYCALLVIIAMLFLCICLFGFWFWKRPLLIPLVKMFIKDNHKRPFATQFVNSVDDDDEPKLEFKNSVYETLDESEANQKSKSKYFGGSTNVAYINDENSPDSLRKRADNDKSTDSSAYPISYITGTDSRVKAMIDSGDGYVQLPGTNEEMDSEEKLKTLFDDPANFPPKPASELGTPKTVVLDRSVAVS